MADIAQIGFQANTAPLVEAKQAMENLSPAATKVDNAAKKIKKGFDDITGSGNKFKQAAEGMKAANDNFAGSIFTSTRNLSMFKEVLLSSVAAFTAFGAAIGAAFSINNLFDFKDALAEVSTQVDTTKFDMQGLEQAALNQSKMFGSDAVGQVKAFYQIISAGISDLTAANNTLTTANQLAIGGATDVFTAADGLTSVLNAYGAGIKTATDAADAMFIAAQQGKTTIGELSAKLGTVAPVAVAMGVSFDELNASIAALTKGGISTDIAVTGLKAILSAVSKPSSEAAKLAKQLGIEFNSAGLQAKGLQGFLEDLTKKTGGNTDALAILVGGVEALVPVLALSGQAGKDFAAIMELMQNKAGTTQEAFDKMSNSPGFQAGRVWAALKVEALGAGSALGDVLVPVLKSIADNMDLITVAAVIFTAGHLAAAILPVIANLVAMTATMGAATVAARGLSAAMMLVGGPIGLATIAAGAAAYLLLRDNTSAAAQAAITANEAFRNNQSALDAAASSSGGYSDALRNQIAMQVAAAQAAYTEAQAYFQVALARRDAFRQTTGFNLAPLTYEVDRADKEATALSGAVMNLQQQLDKVDKGIAANKANLSAPPKVSIPSIGGGGKEKTDPYSEIINKAQQNLATLQAERDAIGLSADAAARLKYETQLLNEAKQKNIELSPNQRSELIGLAHDMADLETATARAKEQFDFMKDATKGFVSDFMSGIRQGKSAWESFANAGINLANKLIDRGLNAIIDKLFEVDNAAGGLGGSGGGGILSWITKGISWLFSAKGNVFGSSGVQAFAKGGAFTNSVVNKPTPFLFGKGDKFGVMGEKGSEAVMPLKRGSDGSLGVQMYGVNNSKNTAQSNHVSVENHYTIAGAVSEKSIVGQIQATAEQTKSQIKSEVVGWLNDFQRDGIMSS